MTLTDSQKMYKLHTQSEITALKRAWDRCVPPVGADLSASSFLSSFNLEKSFTIAVCCVSLPNKWLYLASVLIFALVLSQWSQCSWSSRIWLTTVFFLPNVTFQIFKYSTSMGNQLGYFMVCKYEAFHICFQFKYVE